MKRLMSVLLGLSLVAGTAVIGFAAAPPDTDHKKKEQPKGDPTKKSKKVKNPEGSPR